MLTPERRGDLRRGVARAVLGLLPILGLVVLASRRRDAEVIAITSACLLTAGVGVVLLSCFEGSARRARENDRFWQYLGIFLASGFMPFLLAVQILYLEGLLVGKGGLDNIASFVSRQLDHPIETFLVVMISAAAPLCAGVARIRAERLPTVSAIKIGAFFGLPLILFLPAYLGLVAWIAVYSVAYTLADGLEAWLFRPRIEDPALASRVRQQKVTRIDLELAAKLGDERAASATGIRPEGLPITDLVKELRIGGPRVLSRAAYVLAQLCTPDAKDLRQAREILELAGRSLSLGASNLEVEDALHVWTWHRDSPPSQRALHSLLTIAKVQNSSWANVSIERAADDCAQAAAELTSDESAREVLRAALVPFLLGDGFDPLPELRLEDVAVSEDVSAEDVFAEDAVANREDGSNQEEGRASVGEAPGGGGAGGGDPAEAMELEPAPPNPELAAALEARFPAWEGARRVDAKGFVLRCVVDESRTETYGPGEATTTTNRHYLLVGPRGWLLFRARRRYTASDRFDSDFASLSCLLGSGRELDLGSSSDYEKYDHALDSEERAPVGPLAEGITQAGLEASEERLRALVEHLLIRVP